MKSVARLGDPGLVHCSSYTIASGSPDVFVNAQPAARVGDVSSVHQKPSGDKCVPHVASIVTGSSSVFVNGQPMARVGDALGGCTEIIGGSPNVFTA